MLTDLGSVTLRGDLRAYAWDGGSDLSGGADPDATAGFLLDSSSGTAQFQNVIAEGGIFTGGELENLEISGLLTMVSGARIRTGLSGQNRIEILAPPDSSVIQWHDGGTFKGEIGMPFSDFDITTFGANRDINLEPSGRTFINSDIETSGELSVGGTLGGGAEDFVVTSSRVEAFQQVRIPLGSIASPSIAFGDDLNSGISGSGSDVVSISAGASENLRVGSAISIITPLTTGSAADLFTGAAGLRAIRRSTSARKYKSRITYNVDYLADITLAPTKHYRKDDKRWRYSLIADDLAEADPLLGVFDEETGDVENYDTPAVLAVYAAKLNRLEKAVFE